jgi:hypothetical protein
VGGIGDFLEGGTAGDIGGKGIDGLRPGFIMGAGEEQGAAAIEPGEMEAAIIGA